MDFWLDFSSHNFRREELRCFRNAQTPLAGRNSGTCMKGDCLKLNFNTALVLQATVKVKAMAQEMLSDGGYAIIALRTSHCGMIPDRGF